MSHRERMMKTGPKSKPMIDIICRLSSVKKIAFSCLFLSFLMGVQVCRGQNSDSLKTALKNHPEEDSVRVKLLNTIAETYEDANIDTMVFYASEGLTIAEHINYEMGKALCSSKLGLAYLRKSEYDKSLRYYQEALRSFEKMGKLHSMANTLLSIADIYGSQLNRPLALEYYNRGISVFEKLHYATGEGFAYMSIGAIYEDMGNYSEAINNHLEALRALEKDNYTPGIAMALSSIASIYSEIGDTAKTNEFITKAERVDLSKSTKGQELVTISNIGGAYSRFNSYEKALKCFERAADIADSMGDGAEKNLLVAQSADMYYGLGIYDTAYIKYQEAFNKGKKLDEPISIVDAGNGLGRLLMKNGNAKEGVKYFLNSFHLADVHQQKQSIFETAGLLSEAFEKERNFSEALYYRKIYDAYHDSLFDKKNSTRIQRLGFDYELAKKETRIQSLEKFKVIEETSMLKQRVVLWTLISWLVVLGVITAILYRSWVQLKISRNNEMMQKEELQKLAKKLGELNGFKDKTLSVLSHDLRGPLNAISASISMLDENLISMEEFSQLRPEVNRQLNSLTNMVDNLLNWAKTFMKGQATAVPEQFLLLPVAKQVVQFLQGVAKNKNIDLINDIDGSIESYCDRVQLEIVIRNLLMNALKFTKRSGTITLSAVYEDNNVKVSVTDTGIGMTPEQLAKLFIPANENRTYGTDGESGIGLGLLLCYEFVKANKGHIAVSSEPGSGSTFTVVLPACAPPKS